jgi:hypothetical protein
MKYVLIISFILTIQSQNNITYKQENLQNLLVDLALNYGVEIIVEQSLIKHISITGKIDLSKTITFNLQKILKDLDLIFRIENQNIHIYKKPKPEYTIFGILSDLKNGEKIYLATIIIKDAQKGSSSNENGFFSIGKIPDKKITLIINHVNYYSDTISISFENDYETRRLDIKLKPLTYEEELREIFSNESKLPSRVDEKSTTVKKSYANSIANFIEPDLFRDLQRLPGISALNALSTEFSIRSSAPGENIIMIDGIELYAPYHFGGIFSSFNLQGLREYEIYKDNIPSKYNDKLAGTLNIISKEGNHKEFEGHGQISLLSAALSLEGPLFKGAYFISMRRSFWDLLPGDLYFYLYDLNTNIYQDITENDRISLKFYNSANNLDRREEESIFFDNKLDFSNRLLKLDWRRILSSKLFGKLSISLSRLDLARKSNPIDFFGNTFPSSPTNTIETRNKVSDLSINADFDYHYKNVLINLGYRYKMLDSEFPAINNNNLIIRDYTKSASFHKLYGESEYEFASKLKIAYGASLNYSDEYKRFTFQPKLYLNYKSGIKGLHFFSGVRHNYQEIMNTNSSDSYSRFILDDSFKNIPRLTQLTFGSFYQADHSSAKLSLFKKWSRNLLSLNSSLDSTFSGNFELSKVFLSYNTNIIGAEFYYHYKYGKIENQFSYTITKASELSNNEEKLFYLDRRHNFSYMMNAHVYKKFHFNSHIQIASPFQNNDKLIGIMSLNTRISFNTKFSESYLQFHKIIDETDNFNIWLISIGYKFHF